jgi:oxygen-dependent protoporphyrinogen oxidase
MLNRRPEGVDLARRVGLEDVLVHPDTTSSRLWNRNRLVPLPRTLMGVPGEISALGDVLSKAGLVRAAMEPRLPASLVGDDPDWDISIGHLVEERFGKEVVDRLVEPLLGGVYAGHAREISARAAVPQVLALAARDRSLTRAAQQALSAAPSDVPVFAGLRGGLGQLPEAVLSDAGAHVRTGVTVRGLARTERGWRLVAGSTRDPELIEADAVVLALPASPAARLLSDVAPHAALDLAGIETASSAVVTLAFARPDFPQVAGSGFLVPPVDGHRIKAATFSHQKWGWVGTDEVVVMRCSIGRHREEASLQGTDEELVDISVRELGAAIGLSARPIDSHVQRWGGGLPQYSVGHLARVTRIRADLAGHRGLAVCGASYDGLGVPACISSADRAAAKVLGDLATMDS